MHGGIPEWSMKTEGQLHIIGEALSGRSYSSDWRKYQAWMDAVGSMGVVYVGCGYSAMGQLLNYWMGIERVSMPSGTGRRLCTV